MKKIPTLFKREFNGHVVVDIKNEVNDGLDFVLTDKDVYPTLKIDGSCTAVINHEFYVRYDAKPGKKVPEGAIPCCESDPITGHHPHWVKADLNNANHKWYIEAYLNSTMRGTCWLEDGTYEAIGIHFQGNPYGLDHDKLVRHGMVKIDDLGKINFGNIKQWLTDHNEEGIVFWKGNEPICKIKRKDFGLEWNKNSK